MCTVTFSPRQGSYALAMNRDEKMTRAAGLPPSVRIVQGRSVLAPSEPGGGMWIAVNDSRVTFALVNWHAIHSREKAQPVSRGEVVKAVSSLTTVLSAAGALERLPLPRINPFRLIGIFPGAHEIVEWRWNLKTLFRKTHSWRLRQWISSGVDETRAQRMRGRVFQAAAKQKSVGSLDWLRRLHRSHAPNRGPFSTCMHRSGAVTVSYTEVTVSARMGAMRYFDQSPCHCARGRLRVRTLRQR